MAGPVRKSPRETALAAAPVETKAISLVEKFAVQMGGVDSHKMLATLKATAFRQPARKQGNDWVSPEVTNEQMMALLVVANKYNLNPFVKEIYAFPDKGGIVPIVGVDGWSNMINSHPQFDGIRFEFGDATLEVDGVKHGLPESCTCFIYRKDRQYPTEVTEYLDEVYRAPFREGQSGPWQTHTRRMLRHKAMIQCARLAFGFTGIHDQDEAERIIEGESAVYEVHDENQAKSLTDRFSSDKEAMTAASTAADKAMGKRAGEAIEGEIVEPEPEIEPEGKKEPAPEPEQKVPEEPVKKDEPKIDIVANTMNSIITAETAKEIDEILEAVEEFDIPKGKKMIIKKAATARKKDL